MSSAYTLVRSDRKTLAIEVTREAQILVRAPLRCPQRQIDAFVESRKAWSESAIARQQQRLAQHPPLTEAETEALRQKNQAMEELNRQTQSLAHHQRLEIIGTLTSSISHEFNNLLTPIMGNSLLALEQLPSDEGELYEELLEIYSASCKAKEIISRLSDLSRKNTETCFRQVSPDEVIRKMVRTAEPARAKNVQINMNLNCWEQRLTANEIQISQLMLNLILNGFHAMEPDGGVLTIVSNFDETHIHIQVADTGCGIPKEIQSKIFEPFFTTKETGKGTGLGLAIAAQVVEDHQGSIRVESKQGKGTTFTVSLPRMHMPLEKE
jgi:signal transduction histidine kinase